ncbi:MAG: hypothetical protein MUP09_10465 [Thiovulaceae bacterium]|nr:hypothetical protein [Sulfurimonadaceae bacterium]
MTLSTLRYKKDEHIYTTLSLSVLLTSSILYASSIALNAQLSLVVYNNGIGLVHETREPALEIGKQPLLFPDVANSVQTTVSMSSFQRA